MTDEVCDFCSGTPVVWCYHVFPLPIVVDTGVGVLAGSKDDWAACADCKALVDDENREALFERSLGVFKGDLSPKEVTSFAGGVASIQEQFFSLKNGPGIAA